MSPPGLKDADLSGSNLEGVDLSGVDLDGANLSNANLRGAKLRDAKVTSKMFVEPSMTNIHNGTGGLNMKNLMQLRLTPRLLINGLVNN